MDSIVSEEDKIDAREWCKTNIKSLQKKDLNENRPSYVRAIICIDNDWIVEGSASLSENSLPFDWDDSFPSESIVFFAQIWREEVENMKTKKDLTRVKRSIPRIDTIRVVPNT